MTSIALINANNCQNQGKGCSIPTPTRLVGIFQRAFEEQVKEKNYKKKKRGSKAAFPHRESPFLRNERKERSAEEQSAIISVSSSALDNTKFAL